MTISVFLSHNREDKHHVKKLAHRLRSEPDIEPWLDEWNLIPGQPWQEEIERALRTCQVCVVCVGASRIAQWQHEEMRLAIQRRVEFGVGPGGVRVIPLLLPNSIRPNRSNTSLPEFLTATSWVEFRRSIDDDNAVRRLLCGIRGEVPGADEGDQSNDSPYPGLKSFTEQDVEFFFGREALTEWTVDDLRFEPDRRMSNRFVAIVGPSGSGKSSLMLAGVIPAVRSGAIEGSEHWIILLVRPGARPLESIAVALTGNPKFRNAIESACSILGQPDFLSCLRNDERTLHLVSLALVKEGDSEQHVLIAIDQFEELFTACTDAAARYATIKNLLYAAKTPNGRASILVTLRADFYGKCSEHADLASTISASQRLIGPMTDEELKQAMIWPARLAGCDLEEGLADILIKEVRGQAGALPLLQHVLFERKRSCAPW